MICYANSLIDKCRCYRTVFIYGAGRNAARIYRFLEYNHVQVSGFIVSNSAGNPKNLFGKLVIVADEFAEATECLILVSVAPQSKAYKEILDLLVVKKVQNVYFFPKNLLNILKKAEVYENARCAFNTGIYHLAENVPVEDGHAILAMNGTDGEEYHWRISLWNKFPENIADVFQNTSALAEFEEEYGRYYLFSTVKPQIGYGTCAVYMARSHVDTELVQDSASAWLIPIQVGAALTDRDICRVKDNTGENISERNGNYSECTALYWMWKNAPQTDYIGLCHYRRHFDLDADGLDRLAVSGLDVLVTSPTFVAETVGEFFSTLIPQNDLQAMTEAIKKLHPEYSPTVEKFLKGRFFPPCNLFIMKRSLFLEYGEFIFSTTFEIERYYQSLKFYRNDRYIGYLVECLLGIFLMKNKDQLKIGYTDMRFYS